MKTIYWAWPLLLAPLCLSAQPATDEVPEADIVAVVSSTPLADSEQVPGLLQGQRVVDGLREALELVRGRVPEAASLGLQTLADELRQLMAGDGLASQLPDYYWSGSELWLPVRAELLEVQVDAPDLLPRPSAGQEGGAVENLPAKARRITWIPVARIAQLVEAAEHAVSIGESTSDQAQRQLEEALALESSSQALYDQPLILAYYAVESALATAPDWGDGIRDRLRHAAEALDQEGGTQDAAKRVQAQADRLTPDIRQLEDLALALRRQINRTADTMPSSNRR